MGIVDDVVCINHDRKYTKGDYRMRIFDIYIAGPYTHDDPSVKQMRFNRLTEYAAYLVHEGYNVFSPITSSHPLHYCGIEGEYEPEKTEWPQDPVPPVSWRDMDRRTILGCNELHVLMIPGWSISVGVSDEIAWAKLNAIPVRYISSDDYGVELYE